MRLASSQQIRELDHRAEQDFALTGEILMETAGSLAARKIAQSYKNRLHQGLTIIFCGPGHNGADGLVVARHLEARGWGRLRVYLVGQSQSALYAKQLDRVRLCGIEVLDSIDWIDSINSVSSIDSIDSIDSKGLKVSLIVDGLLGIGASRALSGDFAKTVDWINASDAAKVSLDVPSGLDCDRGIVLGGAVRADHTLTFGAVKTGLLIADGPEYCGRLQLIEIGYPQQLLRQVLCTNTGFGKPEAIDALPKRKNKANKTHFGHAVVIAGGPHMWGAGLLASAAALRIGAGNVTWASFTDPKDNIPNLPDVTTSRVDSEFIWTHNKISAFAVGPGLGVNESTAQLIERLKKQKLPVVLDADALTTCVHYQLFPLPSQWILTPHTGELSRILKQDSATIDRDRIQSARQATYKTQAIVVLKGFRTVVVASNRSLMETASEKDQVVIINSGNSSLAKGGTGDVLTGMIVGLLAQGLYPMEAACTAAYLHGKIADEWVRQGHSRQSLMASDLGRWIPPLLENLRGSY